MEVSIVIWCICMIIQARAVIMGLDEVDTFLQFMKLRLDGTNIIIMYLSSINADVIRSCTKFLQGKIILAIDAELINVKDSDLWVFK